MLATYRQKNFVECPICHCRYSADREDYLDVPPDYQIVCCGKVLAVVKYLPLKEESNNASWRNLYLY